MDLEITFTPQGEAVCTNASGMTFFLTGEPPRPNPAAKPSVPRARTAPAAPKTGWLSILKG